MLNSSQDLGAAVESTEHRLQLIEKTTQRYLSKKIDPRLSRPLLFLLGYVASTIYLVEQATWSQKQRRAEAKLDRWVVEKWTENGGVKETVSTLEKLLSTNVMEGQSEMEMERSLVYGVIEGKSKL